MLSLFPPPLSNPSLLPDTLLLSIFLSVLSSFCYTLQCLEAFLLLHLLSCSQAKQKYLPLHRVPSEPQFYCKEQHTAEDKQINLTEFHTLILLTRGMFSQLQCHHLRKKHHKHSSAPKRTRKSLPDRFAEALYSSTLTAYKLFSFPYTTPSFMFFMLHLIQFFRS